MTGPSASPWSATRGATRTFAEARRLKGRVEVEEYISVHDIDQLFWYFNDRVVKVSAEIAEGPVKKELGVHDFIWITMRFAGGGLGVVETGWGLTDVMAKWQTARQLGRLRGRVPGAARREGLPLPGLPAHDPRRPGRGGLEVPRHAALAPDARRDRRRRPGRGPLLPARARMGGARSSRQGRTAARRSRWCLPRSAPGAKARR